MMVSRRLHSWEEELPGSAELKYLRVEDRSIAWQFAIRAYQVAKVCEGSKHCLLGYND
jgi:hypothetical protein